MTNDLLETGVNATEKNLKKKISVVFDTDMRVQIYKNINGKSGIVLRKTSTNKEAIKKLFDAALANQEILLRVQFTDLMLSVASAKENGIY